MSLKLKADEKITVTILDLFNIWNDAMEQFSNSLEKEHNIKKEIVMAAPLNEKFLKHVQELKNKSI